MEQSALLHPSTKAWSSQRIAAPKFLCNLVFLCFLVAKLEEKEDISAEEEHFSIVSYLSWYAVMLPLFMSNGISFYTKYVELQHLMQSSESVFRMIKQIASLVDLVGSFYAKLVLCVYLTNGYDSNIKLRLSIALLPCWILVGR